MAGKGLITKKIGCTSIWDGDKAVMVTVLQNHDNVVLDQKTEADNGYTAAKIGYQKPKSEKKFVKKPVRGYYEKRNLPVHLHMMEFRDLEAEVGSSLSVTQFEEGEKITVRGRSRGLGFAGVVKRHGFRGGEAAHGAMMHRRSGSLGCRLTPGHVIKGKKMAGRMGFDNITVKNLKIIRIDEEQGLLLVAGAIPGPKGGLVVVTGK
ncbi:MAG: 50S ribosomal protein L3 [Caldisericia bacterium]